MKSLVVSALFGLMASGAVAAAPPEDDPGKRRGGPPRDKRDFFAHMLQRMDADKNGAISFAEFSKTERVSRLTEEQRRRLFDRLDKNKDGEIRREDIIRNGPGPDARPGERRRRENLDTNKDGRVSLEEFRKSPRMAEVPAERQEEIFRKMDRNGDGFLSREDHPRRRSEHPGRGEHSPHSPFRGPGVFEELDTDNNGSLSFEEFRKAPRVDQMDEDRQEDLFEELDRDGDANLRKNEVTGPGRGPGMGPGNGPGRPDKDRRPGKGPKPPRRDDGPPDA